MKLNVRIDGELYSVVVGDVHARPVSVSVDGERFDVWPEEERAAEVAPVRTTTQAVEAPAIAIRIDAVPAAPHTNGNSPAPTNGATAQNGNNHKQVHAPIPGVIISVAVAPGQEVSQGEELCVLEAMKMLNPIRAPKPGKIAHLHVSPGDHVKHRDLILSYES